MPLVGGLSSSFPFQTPRHHEKAFFNLIDRSTLLTESASAGKRSVHNMKDPFASDTWDARSTIEPDDMSEEEEEEEEGKNMSYWLVLSAMQKAKRGKDWEKWNRISKLYRSTYKVWLSTVEIVERLRKILCNEDETFSPVAGVRRADAVLETSNILHDRRDIRVRRPARQ